MKLSNKWRVSARVTPEMNKSLNDMIDHFKIHDSLKVRGRSARREHVIQLAILEMCNHSPDEIAARLSELIPTLESMCD